MITTPGGVPQNWSDKHLQSQGKRVFPHQSVSVSYPKGCGRELNS